MATAPDLWGNLETEHVTKSPLSILKEQAALLGKKTGNVLEARVETIANAKSGDFIHRLLLVAPALDNYTYELLRFTHSVKLYPVNPSASMTLGHASGYIVDEATFLKWLQEQLSSPQTHQIISNLLEQSRS